MRGTPRNRPWTRRSFLASGSIIVGLPWLESVSRPVSAAPDADPPRFIAFYTGNGMVMSDWTPTGVGSDFSLSPTLQPLEAVKNDIIVVSGLNNTLARDPSAAHISLSGGFLTSFRPDSNGVVNRTSMDQVYAKAIEGITPIASLQLRCAGGENQGCEDGYPCVYGEVVSWEGSNPLTPLTKPQTIFDLLFSGFDPSLSNAELERIRRQRLSVLDPVLEQSQRLQAKLSGDDRGRIEEYFSAVRDLEHRIETQSSAASCDPSLLEIAGGYDDETDAAYYATMMDLIVLALQCDQTRVVSFMLNSALNFRRYEFLGIEKTHHYMTHSRSAGEDPSNLEGCKTINRWEVEQLAALLQKLSETPDASGDSLLDNTIVYFANEMAMYSQSGKTSHSDKGIPIVVGGRGGGLQTGRHLEYDDLPTADLFTTLLQKMGVDIDRFGDVGNGPLDL